MRYPHPTRRPLLAVLALVLPAALLALALLPATAGAAPKLDDYAVGNYAIGGDFTLTNQDGGKTRLSDYRGKAVLLAFGYTSCPDVCPTTLSDFKLAKQKLGAQADKLQALFISVDPKRDSPERLKQYVGHFDPTFVGLTGSEDTLHATAERYMGRFRYRDTGSAAGYAVDHTAFIYLIDPQGKVRYLFTPDVKPAMLAEGVEAVLGGRS